MLELALLQEQIASCFPDSTRAANTFSTGWVERLGAAKQAAAMILFPLGQSESRRCGRGRRHAGLPATAQPDRRILAVRPRDGIRSPAGSPHPGLLENAVSGFRGDAATAHDRPRRPRTGGSVAGRVPGPNGGRSRPRGDPPPPARPRAAGCYHLSRSSRPAPCSGSAAPSLRSASRPTATSGPKAKRVPRR